MRLVDFLLARQDEEEKDAISPRTLAEIKLKRKIIAFHQAWPVLVEERPKFKRIERESDLENITNAIVMEMQTKYQWMLAEDYRKIFGEEPPSAPILKEMGKLYSDHPDYNPEWS